MTGVVLRCPNCGTTRATPGECEACHDAQVRYYCTNHKPGLWLDTPTCSQCGARFGEPSPTRPVAPGRAPRPPSPPPPPPRRTPAGATPPPRVEPVRGPRGRAPDRGRRPRSPYEVGGRGPEAADPLARLRDILRTAARARRSPWGDVPVPPPVPRLRLPLAGCLFRLLLFLLLMMLLAFGSTFMLLGGGLLELLGG